MIGPLSSTLKAIRTCVIVSFVLLACLRMRGQVCYEFSGNQDDAQHAFKATVRISDIPTSLNTGAGTSYSASFHSVKGLALKTSNYSPLNRVTVDIGHNTYAFNVFSIAITPSGNLVIGGLAYANIGTRPSHFSMELDAPTGVSMFPGGLSQSLPSASAWNGSKMGSLTLTLSSARGLTGNSDDLGGQITSLDTTCGGTTPPTLVDPVPELLKGPQISTAISSSDGSPPYLSDSTKGRVVQGVTADGVTQVVIRIPASRVGEQFTLSLGEEQCKRASLTLPQCIDQYGVLFDPANPPTSDQLFGDQITTTETTVKAVSTESGPMAVAAYRAPLDFVRSNSQISRDATASSRSVFVSVNSGKYPSIEIFVLRPPVVLIHGLFSGPEAFDNFSPVMHNSLFQTFTLDYSQDIDAQVTSTMPDYGKSPRERHIKRNVVGIAYNAPLLLANMIVQLTERRSIARPLQATSNAPRIVVAAIQVDIVAHSLGGLMARGMGRVGIDFPATNQGLDQSTAFYSVFNYGRGYIHKMVTLGTPHLGTSVTAQTLADNNKCVRDGAADFGEYNLSSLVIDGDSYNGAALDLEGYPQLPPAKSALTILNQPRSMGIPTAFIAGRIASTNDGFWLHPIGTIVGWLCGTKTVCETKTGPSWVLGNHPGQGCRIVPGGSLADTYNFDSWKITFEGEASDGLVPVMSATYGNQANSWVFDGVVHGPGSVGAIGRDGPHMGFAGPQLLEPDGPAAIMTLQLLNTSVVDRSKFLPVY